MTCLSDSTIVGLLERGLPSEQRAEIEAHLDVCASCRRVVVDLTAVLTRSSTAAEDGTTHPARRSEHGQEPELGAMVGRFVVLGLIGRGGMGTVYTAYDPELDRNIALKLLHRQARTVDKARAQILAEAQAMARISHPGVVAIYEVGTFRDRVFAAMELVEGTTLRAWITEQPRSWHEVVAVFLLAGEGLAAAHAAGVVHRDFKPENVLLGRDGRVKVSDFGLSSPSTAGGGAVAGTPGYLPLEAVRGEGVDHRADQFAFCVALYEALHGRRPFSARTADDLAAEVRRGPVFDRRTRGVPKQLNQIVHRGLALAPEDRHASVRELLDALRRTTSRRGARRSRRITTGAFVMAAVTMALAGGHAVHVRNAAEERTQLVGRLRGLAPDIRMRLSRAQMLPLHDIRSAHDDVRRAMREVERLLQTPAGRDEIALGTFVLGEAQRALGDHEHALSSLEAAWTAGERGPDIDAALGYELGARYESQLDEIERAVPSAGRDAQIRAIERRYRDPAMLHLRAALAAGNGSPTYLRALIAFHDHRFAASSLDAHAAFVESPMFFEAGVLEARARNQLAVALLSAGKAAEANDAFLAARRAFQNVLEVARSNDEMWLGYAEMALDQAAALTRDGEMPAELRQETVAALRNVQRINPDNWRAFLREARIDTSQGNNEVLWYRDPAPYVERALALAEQSRAHGASVDEVDVYVCLA